MHLNLHKTIYMLSKYFLYGFIFQTMALNFVLATDVSGQYKSIDKVQVKIHGEKLTLDRFFKSIETQTSFSFLYDARQVDTQTVIRLNQPSGTVESLLKQVSKQSDLRFRQVNNAIDVRGSTRTLKENPSIQRPDVKITGKVTDEKGEPLPGVTIVVRGTTKGTVTNIDGEYALDAPEDGVLVFSFIGYDNQSIVIGNQQEINVTLAESLSVLEEVVVTGYRTQTKRSVTGAVATMTMDENLTTIPTTSAGNLLVGKLAGVDVSTPSAIPGAQPTISIRTGSSWNAQNVIYVIDGVIRGAGDFNSLSPNEIKDVTVLKDAASAAIYGSRSAGGVIIVTTKRGNVGKPTFNYLYGFSVDTRTNNMDLTSAVQAGELYTRINGSSDPAGWAWSQEEIDHYKNINNGWGYDQLETVWQNPTTQSHNLSVNGGNDNVRYFGAASYVKQQGFLEPMTYEKYNIRMNVTADVTKNLEIFTGFALYNNFTGNIADNAGPGDTYAKLRIWQPDQPVYTDGGQYIDYGWIGNVGARVSGTSGYNKMTNLKPQLILSGTYKIPFLKGLSAKVQYSKSWTNDMQKIFYTNYNMMVMERSGQNGRIISTNDDDVIGIRKSTWVGRDYIERRSTWSGDKQFNMQLNYENHFKDKHYVSAVFVSEWYEGSGAGVIGGRETFPVYLTDQFWAASGARADTWGNGDTDWINGRMSYIGQFNYSYSDKYLVSLSFREDGSMNFAPDQRWGFFPAGSLGWVISEENFFGKSAIQFMKFRASIGLTGNDAVGGWQWQESYQSGNSAYFGTSPSRSVGITYGNVVNPNLTWEKALSYNFGLDMNFMQHMNLAVDYWFRDSYDILGNRQNSLPSTFSMSMPAENYGQIYAQGMDLALGYRNGNGKLSYFANLNMSYGWNEVMRQDYPENAQWIDIPVGKSRNYISGWAFDQIIRTQEQLDAFNTANPNYKHNGLSPDLGMMVYKDMSGPSGEPDGIIDSWDRVLLEANNFPVVYGLNLGGSWKGFHLEMMLSGRLGEKKWNTDMAGGVEWNRMWDQWYDDSWTPENPNATLPKRISNNSPKTYQTNSGFWLQDASFVRMKYLTLSYNLPQNSLTRVFDNVRLFVTGTNLFVLSKFNRYYDPEISNGNAFPVLRSTSFGIDVKF